MKQIKIEKTATGYILRQSLGYTLLKGLNAAIYLALGIYGCTIPWWARDQVLGRYGFVATHRP